MRRTTQEMSNSLPRSTHFAPPRSLSRGPVPMQLGGRRGSRQDLGLPRCASLSNCLHLHLHFASAGAVAELTTTLSSFLEGEAGLGWASQLSRS